MSPAQDKKKKRCTKCKKLKPLKDFAKEKFGAQGRKSCCKECRKWIDIYKKYKLTKEEWESLLKKQGSTCAICHRDKPKDSHWHTDHNHATGAIRGILCHHCNQALGIFFDSPVFLQSAMDYLNRNEFSSIN